MVVDLLKLADIACVTYQCVLRTNKRALFSRAASEDV